MVTKRDIINLEAHILISMGFDFNFPGPIQTMERYMRILNYDFNKVVYDMAFQICKFQLNDATFLNYAPSKVAASSLLLAINIYEWDMEKKKRSGKSFFKNCPVRHGLVGLNLEVWNTEQVYNLTGYSIEDLKNCLYDLSVFIWNSLTPNRLENFDIKSILNAKKFKSSF